MTGQNEQQLLSIGQFRRLSRLSRKALRLYDDRGLLPPAIVDPQNGYRFYTRPQVITARRIRLLRLMEMPLEGIAEVLQVWAAEPATARRLIEGHVKRMRKRITAVELAADLLFDEIKPRQEFTMSFTFNEQELRAQNVVSIKLHITVPAFHQSIPLTLRQLWDHIQAHGAETAGDPVALYYGPVSEEDDGPVEIAVPFSGQVPPAADIRVRQLPAHKAVQLRTYDEYNEYPKLLEMWNALGKYVHDHNLEPDWEHDMTTYEIWHADETMTIGWPVKAFTPAPT